MSADRKIILASRSRARRDLLRQIGLRFSVMEPRVRESGRAGTGCAELVERNALKKARYVAGRVRSGTIIGADTMVRAGRRILGKPKNVREAAAMLAMLSRRPQWVYTGIAVIDADTGKTYTAHEKTKVLMRPMGRAEIEEYFKKVSPLSLAGAFDAQGHGAIFIRRVEGCYYNVVGLPLSKLAMLLRKAGVSL